MPGMMNYQISQNIKILLFSPPAAYEKFPNLDNFQISQNITILLFSPPVA